MCELEQSRKEKKTKSKLVILIILLTGVVEVFALCEKYNVKIPSIKIGLDFESFDRNTVKGSEIKKLFKKIDNKGSNVTCYIKNTRNEDIMYVFNRKPYEGLSDIKESEKSLTLRMSCDSENDGYISDTSKYVSSVMRNPNGDITAVCFKETVSLHNDLDRISNHTLDYILTIVGLLGLQMVIIYLFIGVVKR